MDHRTSSPLRLLAPVALAVFGVVFLIVAFSSGGDESVPGSETGSEQAAGEEGEAAAEGSGPKRYTVEAGDTLDGIASKTGVAVEELERVNPDLDAQALTTGQKIKLRE